MRPEDIRERMSRLNAEVDKAVNHALTADDALSRRRARLAVSKAQRERARFMASLHPATTGEAGLILGSVA